MADLIIKIAGDISDFKASLDQVGESAASSGDSLTALAVPAAAAFTALAAAIGVCVDAYAETEQASKEVNLALQNQGIYSDYLVKSYKEMADAQSKLTGIDADQITKGQAQLQNLIGMQNITPQLTQAMVDLSAKTGSVASAAQLLGQWIDGNTRGMKLYNLAIDENTDEQGRTSQIIDQVNQKFGGLAESMNTGLGSMKGLKTAITDIAKDIGEIFAPAVTSATGLLTEFFQRIHDSNKLAADPMHQLDEEIAAVEQGLKNISKGGTYINVNTGQVITDVKQLNAQLDILNAKRDDLQKASRGASVRQDPDKSDNAKKANDLRKAQDSERRAAARDTMEAMRSDLDAHNQEVTKLLKDQASLEKQLSTEQNGEMRGLLQEKLANIKDELESQREVEVDQTKTLNEEIFNNQKQFNDMSIEETKEFLKKNKAQLLSSIDNEKTAREKAALDESKVRVKAHNQFLQDELKFGKAYATINMAMHSEVLTGTKQAFGDLANLTQSGNQTLKEIGKVASVANITIKTAEAAMNIYSGFAEIPIVGIALGIAGAAAAVAFGAEQIGNVMGAADGGLITGGIPGIDSVPVLAQSGELIAPKQNFDEVVDAVANKRAGVGNGNGNSGGTVGIVISMDGKEAERVLTARQNEARGLGIWTGFLMISGGIKFFELSANLLVNGANASATSGNDSVPYILGLNRDTSWRSVSSLDSITEKIIVAFPVPTFIDRLFIINHNLKNYTVQYNVMGTWTDFTNVKGISGALGGGIAESNFALDTSYYEFDGVTTDSIQIVMNTTQVADQDKFINQVTFTSELGTLVGYPIVSELDVNRSMRANQTVSGKYIVEKSIETVGFNLQLKKYATSPAFVADFDLLMSLHDREKAFNAWLCGGRQGTSYFNVTLRGFRLRDVYQMQLIKPLNTTYDQNMYRTQINGNFNMYEHI